MLPSSFFVSIRHTTPNWVDTHSTQNPVIVHSVLRHFLREPLVMDETKWWEPPFLMKRCSAGLQNPPKGPTEGLLFHFQHGWRSTPIGLQTVFKDFRDGSKKRVGASALGLFAVRHGSIRCALGTRAATVRKRVSGYFLINAAS